MKKFITPVLAAVIILLTTYAYADFFNNRNVLMGERAAMLGGAYTALSEDVSGAYYNPAGIAFIRLSMVSLSASAYSYKQYSRQDTEGKASLRKFESVPVSFGISFNAEPFVFAFGLFQTDNMQFSVLRVENDVSYKIEIDNQSYLAGPSVGVRFNDRFSLGLSAHYYYFQGKMIFSDDDGTDVHIKQNQVQSGGINISGGLLFKITDTFRAGLRYTEQTIHTNGTNTYSWANAAVPDDAGSADGDIRSPRHLALGIAYSIPGKFTVTADVICYLKMRYNAPHAILHTTESGYKYSERLHLDAALGMEYFINETYSLRLGFSTNTSSATDTDRAERINCYTGTIGVGRKSGDLTSGFGIGVMYGTSDWQANSGDPAYPGKWTRLDVKLMIGSSYTF